MFFTFVIFCISLLGTAIMLLLKLYENKYGKKTLISRLSIHDEKVGETIDQIKRQVDESKERIIIFTTTKLPAHAIHKAIQVKEIIKERYDKMAPNIRGSRILKPGGKVSEYLKEIANHQKQNGKGRIGE